MKQYHSGFEFKPENGLLSLHCAEVPECFLTHSQFCVVMQDGSKEFHLTIERLVLDTEKIPDTDGIGCGSSAATQSFRWINDEHELAGYIDFAIPADKSWIACRLQLINRSKRVQTLQRINMIQAGKFSPVNHSTIQFSSHDRRDDIAFLSNGWQSWSFSGVYSANDRQRRSMLSFIPNAASSNPETPISHSRDHFTGEFFGVLGNRRTRTGLLCGFLSQQQHFGCLEADLRGETGFRICAQGDQTHLLPGTMMKTDWLFLSWIDLDDPQAMLPYLDLAAEVNHARIPERLPNGWCSWYQYETDISADKILENTRALTSMRCELPVELVQIDDGFQTAGGDWFDFCPSFPNGVAPIASAIREAGMMPGIWLAPFIVSRGAKLIKKHPDYLLKSQSGRLVNAGFISNKLSLALDLSYPPALEYACKVVKTAVQEWGFPYLKLDFLYAGALSGNRYDPTITRAQILRKGLEALRASVGQETFLLGCGVPLGSALGIFDGMRIGADTAGFWKPKLFNIPWIFQRDPQLPSTRNAIQNTILRSTIHAIWWANDPDCLLLRPNTELSLDEVKTHTSMIAFSGGSVLLSDDLNQLPSERIRMASVLLPLIGQRPQVMDWIDRLTPRRLRLDLQGETGLWHLLGYFNWSEDPEQILLSREEFNLDVEHYLVHSFWDGLTRIVDASEDLWSARLPAHGCVVLAVRHLQNTPQYLGSDIHISQGLEIKNWQVDPQRIRCLVDVGHHLQGSLYLRIPAKIRHCEWQGKECIPKSLMDDVYEFHIQSEGSGWLDIALV